MSESERRRRVRWAWAGGGGAALLVAAVLAVLLWPTSEPDPVVEGSAEPGAGEPGAAEPEDGEPAEQSDEGGDEDDEAAAGERDGEADDGERGDDEGAAWPGGGRVTVGELGVDVFVAPGGARVRVLTADGGERSLPLEPAPASPPRLVPDGAGGVAWQAAGGTDRAPVRHVDEDGQRILLRPSEEDERLALVGRDGGALVTRTRGTGPGDTRGDLLSVPFDGAEPTTVREDVAAWESGVTGAVGQGVLLVARAAEATSLAVVDPPGDEATTVFEGGEATREHVAGVAAPGPDTGVVLVRPADPDRPGARLLLVDLEAAEVTAEIDVPPGLGGEPGARARSVSAHDGLVLVNREADGTAVTPLVYSLRADDWAVLDRVTGPAALARPAGQ